MEAVGMSRTDKVKPVREAALEAIQMVRELPEGRMQKQIRVNKNTTS